jgi:hypothetical protein
VNIGRTRGLLLAALLGVAIVSSGAALGVYRLATSEACGLLPREDLSLREMADLRHVLDGYKTRIERLGPPLELTSRQTAFLLREELDVPAWIEVHGPVLRLEGRFTGGNPEGRCWNVTYRGSFRVEGGQAYVVPDTLWVGRLDLGWWLRDQRVRLPPVLVKLGGLRLVDLFSHLELLELGGDKVSVRLDDPRWIR